MDYLGEVVRNFDIVAVQEIKDISGQVPEDFVEEINSTGRNYQCEVSERTGQQDDDRSSQEQYAFCFDTDRIELIEPGFLFDDSANDLFQREPFSAYFRVHDSDFEFALTTVHTRPESAVEEIAALNEVHLEVADRFPMPAHHIILGDFNAGCNYANAEELDELEIRSASFIWIVPDSADTNVSPNSACAYDRFVSSVGLLSHFVSWGISDWFDDKRISDHWPVWIRLSIGSTS